MHECAFDSVHQIGCTKRLVTVPNKMKETTELDVELECSSVLNGLNGDGIKAAFGAHSTV